MTWYIQIFTFEHLQQPEQTIEEIARLLKPSGITARLIDIEDHKAFSRPFDYLMSTDEEWEAQYGEGGRPLWTYENRYRASDFCRFFEKVGLEIVERKPLRSAKIPEEVRARLAPRFRSYNLDDLQIVWFMIVARKPADKDIEVTTRPISPLET